MLHVALWEPEIPPNTCNVARLCAATGAALHLIGRLGFDSVNAVLIISGAFGLFKRELVEAVGGYAHNTVGEDAELVARLQGYLRQQGDPGARGRGEGHGR